jgi:hypothetical protein
MIISNQAFLLNIPSLIFPAEERKGLFFSKLMNMLIGRLKYLGMGDYFPDINT